MNQIIRPKQLRYGFNEKPPLAALILLACQQLIPLGISLTFTSVLLDNVSVEANVAASLVSIILITSAITTLIQSQNTKWFLGSGTFLPLSATSNLLAQSILAINIGGLPLLFGMTLFAGVMQAVFSLFIDFIRKCFPPEIAAMVLVLIGIDLGMLGINSFISFHQEFSSTLFVNPVLVQVIELLPLLLIIAFNCWGNKFFKTYGLIVSVLVGYLLIVLFGLMDKQDMQAIHQAPWIFLPTLSFVGNHQFSAALIIPFLIGALVNTIKICGSVAGLQELQDVNFKQPNMTQISRANFTDSLGTIMSGLTGGICINTSASAIAISMSTGITSRYIAYPFAMIVFAIACCPKISLLFVYMPKALSGAILFCLGSTLLSSGAKMMLSYIKNYKKQLYIGVSFVLGLSRDVYPDIYTNFPIYIKSVTGSSIVIAAISAVILNFLININVRMHIINLHDKLLSFSTKIKFLSTTR